MTAWAAGPATASLSGSDGFAMWTPAQSVWPWVFLVLLWGLGFAAVTLAGIRDPLLRAALAVPATVAAVAVSTLGHVVVPVRFSWASVVLVLAVGALAVRLGRRLLPVPAGAHAAGIEPGDRAGRGSLWRLLGVLALCSLAAQTAVFVACGWSWELLSQTWDAIFDANATRFVYETGQANPLKISDFAFPKPVHTYYPSSFHSLGALFMQLSGEDAVVATNVLAAVIAGTLWPSSAVVAAWIVVGPQRVRPATMALLSGGFWAMPWGPLGWGVLWASALAAVFVPVVVALAVTVVSPNERLGRRGAAVLATGGLALIGVLHPRIAVITGLILVGLAGVLIAVRVVRLARAGAWGRVLALVLPTLVGLAAFVQVVRRVGRDSSQFGVRVWPVERSAVLEVLGYLWNGPGGSLPQPITAAVLLVGAVAAWRRRAWLPVVVVAAGAVLLDILTATVRGVWAFDIVARFWYNDRVRTQAVAAGALIVLLAVGWSAVTEWWDARLNERGGPAGRRAAAYPSIVAALALALGTACAIPYLSERYIVAANHPTLSLVTEDEIRAFHAVAEIVPEGDRILNNANDGSALLYAYVNRKPTLYIAGLAGSTTYSEYLRDQLIQLEPSNICKLMRADGIRWVINNGRAYANGVIDEATSPNLQIPPGFPLMTERMRMGHTALFELTGCRP